MSLIEVRIPDVGDAEEVEVIEICVAEGDEIPIDTPLVVIESEKASMELPAEVAGKVVGISLAVGDIVNEGDLVATIETDGNPARTDAADSNIDEVREDKTSAVERRRHVPRETDDGNRDAPTLAGTPQVEVRVPDLGDAEDVVVIEVPVAPGDAVLVDDPLVVIESEKASMEIPSPVNGKVKSVALAVDDEVVEGALVAVIAPGDPTNVAVGIRQANVAPSTVVPDLDTSTPKIRKTQPLEPGVQLTDETIYAGPAVRRLARELGVELNALQGSGAQGRIVKDDVKAYVKAVLTSSSDPNQAVLPSVPSEDFTQYGAIEEVELSRVRRTGAVNLHRSWLNVVHVTQHDLVDATHLEDVRAKMKRDEGIESLTPLAFVLKASALSLAEFPRFNASLGPTLRTLILKKYCHIGFAVDTDAGLLVPVIRDVDEKGIVDLAEEVTELSQLARGRKLRPEHMAGGCFTVSSLGAIGGTGFTPIVNAPELAILGIARMDTQPLWDGQQFVPRKMLPVSLSYDHRAINGAEAGRFVQRLGQILTEPESLLR